MTETSRFEPLPILRTLADAGVRFVLIGGVAANYAGSPIATFDLDICYARDRENLESLAVVLQKLGASLRGAPPGLPFRLDAKTLANGDSFTFITITGDLDILGTPSGTEGYNDLAKGAIAYDIDGVRILVASVDDLIRMKRASGRVKDRIHLEHLGALRDELDRRKA
jgi:hypothetical protein